ncbi:NAD-dependent epimerase/dehydratase family protein [Pelagibacteraceae bacterium]|nr:NAD-dependent epimerase/dehydratase family protein [Pelagibacteraceae bacterium]
MLNSKKIIIVTGGAGFIGSNLIKLLIDKTKFLIISLDNYSSGAKKNHIRNKRIKYIKGDTKNISQIIKNSKQIHTVFHFGEFARIYQSFLKMSECINSNSIGTNAIFNFCLKNKTKLIYSATSATLGNQGNDKNLSPYAFTKAKNLELLENLKKWFNFKFEVIYFYNVYGPNQIGKGSMATIIGIFENLYETKKALTVVKPGSQTRRFTHVLDTVNICYLAWKKNLCRHYSISNKEFFSILDVAKMFKSKIKYLPKRAGERYASSLLNTNLSNKVHKYYGKISLKKYINEFLKNNS